MPLWTRLRNGQSVEIIRAEGQRPQPSWEEMVVTGRAKSAIRRSLREDHKSAHIRLGREIARVALEKIGKKATDKALETAAKQMSLPNADELLARLGSTEITGADLVNTLYPELVQSDLPATTNTEAHVIGLAEGQSHIIAPCCQPLPGERIVGISTHGQGVVVHAIDCDSLVQFEDQPERWIDLRWTDGMSSAEHLVSIEVIMANDAGVLGRICTLIGEHNANISDMTFTDKKSDFYRVEIALQVRDITHLHRIQTALEADTDIASVARTRRAEARE